MGVLLAALQVLFAAATGYKDTPSPVRLCDGYLGEGCDVLYLGDSTLYSVAPDDEDKAHTDQMLQRLLPGLSVCRIAHDAYHLELYEAFCRYVAGKVRRPRVVIMPINLGTLSPYWDRRPEYQFERIKLFLRHDNPLFRAFYRPLATFRVFDLAPISQEEYDQTPVYDGEHYIGPMATFTSPEYATFSDEHMRNQLVLRYLYPIPSDQRKLEAMEDIVDRLESANVMLVFYLTPIDFETGNTHMGERFQQHIRENAHKVLMRLQKRGVKALDLSLALSADCFYWGNMYVNEHLNQHGRRFVAEQLARAIKERLRQ